MPTYSSITLENLLEPGVVRDSLKKTIHSVKRDDSQQRHLYISPALYATPEQSPIPEYSSPEPLSLSPYVANSKRRRGGNESVSDDSCQVSNLQSGNEGNDLGFGDDERFVDPIEECMSLRSEDKENDCVGKGMESRSFVSAQGEFFDAIDDFSSDGSLSNTPSNSSRIESELQSIKLGLFEEIEKRKHAEETLVLMHNQWERISHLMSTAGFTFPTPPIDSENMIDQFSQEFTVSRFVAEAVGRGQARAEAEEEAAAAIESKDLEISRLRDRLQYYETVNHEMSQRNLVVVARRQRDRKLSRRRWLWSFMGLSIALGTSFLAYSYIPQANKSDDSTDA